jgi:hypothetical protein
VWERIGKLPLSVSTDRIAYCAMRCAAILDGLGPRDGSGRVLEAYPDAALRCWVGGPWASYKGPARVRREVLLAPLLDVVALSAAQVEACVAWDDNLDALVCALVARAAALGETIPPPPELERLALVEGWIHLPRAGSLSRIGRAGAPGRSR